MHEAVQIFPEDFSLQLFAIIQCFDQRCFQREKFDGFIVNFLLMFFCYYQLEQGVQARAKSHFKNMYCQICF